MLQVSKSWIVLPLLTVIAVATFIWKKNRHTYVRVGRIKKILFYPVKSLKGIELSEAECTESGFVVHGLYERSFMLMTKDLKLLSQCEAPKLSLLTPKFVDSKLVICGPNSDTLTLSIDSVPNKNHEIIEYCMKYRFLGVISCVVDCGDHASRWFQSYLSMPDIRLVRFFPDFPKRNLTWIPSFFSKLKKINPKDLQDLAAVHLMSQSSIDDLNSRLVDRRVSHINFRPNILVDECAPFAEDSWHYMKLGNQCEMERVIPVARCLMTTMEPEKGILTQNEPMVTLRKYRIPRDPKILQITGAIPCFGQACFLLRTGTIKLQDDIFATITKPFDTV
ncbi:mitochondrial amidoxime-reducing component 1-like isoform X2 [Parasteatoda tepidariorum]|nr:mitochondrial amidoxime-reducing component 1-like isoform X2 [Parasteatoda tepidariorum]